MAIVSCEPFWMPDWRSAPTTVTGLAAGTQAATTIATLDGASDAFALTLCPPVSGSLTDFYWRTGTTAVTSGPLNFDGRIESLNSSGRPSGTLLGTDSNGAVAVADTDDNVIKTCTLTTAVSVDRQTPFAIRVNAPGSGTFSMTHVGFSLGAGFGWFPNQFPLYMVDTNGDGTFDVVGGIGACPILAVKISGVWYTPSGCHPFNGFNYVQYGSATNPNERALRCELPYGVRIDAMRSYCGNVATGGSITHTAWPDSASSQTDANALAQIVLDSDAAASNTQDNWIETGFTPFDVAAATPFWLGSRADSATNRSVMQGGIVSGAESAVPGGAEFYLGTRNWSAGSANAFTADQTNIPMMQFRVIGIEVGGAGGGGGAQVIQIGGARKMGV